MFASLECFTRPRATVGAAAAFFTKRYHKSSIQSSRSNRFYGRPRIRLPNEFSSLIQNTLTLGIARGGLRCFSSIPQDPEYPTNINYTKLPRLLVTEDEEYDAISASCHHVLKDPHDIIPVLLPKETQGTAPEAPSLLYQGKIVTLSMEQSNYLSKVLRYDKKTEKEALVRLADPRGTSGDWLAQVVSGTDNDSARTRKSTTGNLVVLQCIQEINGTVSPQPVRPIWLCAAPPKKKERIRFLVEKTTELDVSGFVFLDTDYSEESMIAFSKLLSYTMEAVEQCERTTLPHFISFDHNKSVSGDRQRDSILKKGAKKNEKMPTMSLQTVLSIIEEHAEKLLVMVCRERSSNSSLSILEHVQQNESASDQPILLFVGPEGGWSPDELNRFDQMEHDGKLRSVSLGSTILRAETAAISCVAVCRLAAP